MEKEGEQAQYGEKECKGYAYQPVYNVFHSTFFSDTNVDIFINKNLCFRKNVR